MFACRSSISLTAVSVSNTENIENIELAGSVRLMFVTFNLTSLKKSLTRLLALRIRVFYRDRSRLR